MPQVGVGNTLFADGGHGAVPGIDLGVIGQGEQITLNRCEQLVMVATPEVRAADRSSKNNITNKDEAIPVKRNVPWRMTRCMENFHFRIAHGQGIALFERPFLFRTETFPVDESAVGGTEVHHHREHASPTNLRVLDRDRWMIEVDVVVGPVTADCDRFGRRQFLK